MRRIGRTYDQWKTDGPPYYNDPEPEKPEPDPDELRDRQIDRLELDRQDEAGKNAINDDLTAKAAEMTAPCQEPLCKMMANEECLFCHYQYCDDHLITHICMAYSS